MQLEEKKKDRIAQKKNIKIVYSPPVQPLARDNKMFLFTEKININVEVEKKNKF